jgi:pyrimidine-nucleoside phosphorylase
MKTHEDAQNLAKSLVEVGRGAGVKVDAMLTRMEQPLGFMIGNALEVVESVTCLRGGGPADIDALVIEQATALLLSERLVSDPEAGRRMARRSLDDGSALKAFRDLVAAQGGDVAVIDAPERFPRARLTRTVVAVSRGFVTQLKAERFGRAIISLGGGRRTQDDVIDPSVGILLHRKVGDAVEAGTPLFTLYANDGERLREAIAGLEGAFGVGPYAEPEGDLILERL